MTTALRWLFDADMSTSFRGGINLAMKIPAAAYEKTVRFYRETLGLPLLEEFLPHVVIQFGPNQLWLDKDEKITKSEIWLEIETPDTSAAAAHFAQHQVRRCDEIEPLPAGLDAFWIQSPAAAVHLVINPDA